MDFTGIGIYSTELRFGDPEEITAAAQELEALGFTALWLPGAFGGPIFEAVERVLDATENIMVATGIVNIWAHEPEESAAAYTRIAAAHPGRFLMAIGSSHAAFVNALGLGNFGKPLTKMRGYLDGLDACDPPVPADGLALAALRPKMRALAAERTRGIHTYFVTPAHTKLARDEAPDGTLLAVEHAVVVDDDPETARETARRYTGVYLTLPAYTDNLKMFGWEDADFEDGGSDALVDELVAWGTPEQIRARLQAHLDAGADHVCAQVLQPGWDAEKIVAGQDVHQPIALWRDLAAAVTGAAHN